MAHITYTKFMCPKCQTPVDPSALRRKPYCPRCGTGFDPANVTQAIQTQWNDSVASIAPFLIVVCAAGALFLGLRIAQAFGRQFLGWVTVPTVFVLSLVCVFGALSLLGKPRR